MAKRYWWVKLPTTFFSQPEIKILLGQKDGAAYVVFLLKLMTDSVNAGTPGVIQVPEEFGSVPLIIAGLTNTDESTAEAALNRLGALGLVEVGDETLLMPWMDSWVGSETDSAQRMRRHRVTSASHSDRELESEKELELEKNKKGLPPPDAIPYGDILGYLNQKADRAFSPKTESHRKLIRTIWKRLPDIGVTRPLAAFREVIDVKVRQWGGNPDMRHNLRPETLFRSFGRFESYLNESPDYVRFMNGRSH